MRALSEGRAEPDAEVVGHLDLCLGCRACETACPSGVEYGLLIESTRHHLEDAPVRTRWERRWRRRLATLLPHPDRLRRGLPLVRFANRLGVARLSRASWLPLRLRRLAALLPEVGEGEVPAVLEPAGPAKGTVALLEGCVARTLFPDVNEKTARLLALAGYRVVSPPRQVCCGALPAHLGAGEEARELARRNTNVFLLTKADFLVTNAAGCGAMLRDYGRLLADEEAFAAGAEHLAGRVRDVSELLIGNLPAPRHRSKVRIAYHDACHLEHGQGVTDAPRELLRSIPGVELVDIRDGLCCGSAGTYNLTEPEMAWRLAERKADAVEAAAPEIVAAGNPGCLLQIRAALRLRKSDIAVRHTVEIVADAYDERLSSD